MIIIIEDIAYNTSRFDSFFLNESENGVHALSIVFNRDGGQVEYHSFNTIEEARKAWSSILVQINRQQ